MPKRKTQQRKRKQVDIPPPDDYYGCVEYGMDDYDDPTEHMTPEQIEALAQYVQMMEGCRDFDEPSGDEGDIPPPYTGEFIDDEAEEGEETEESEEEEEEDDDDDDEQ